MDGIYFLVRSRQRNNIIIATMQPLRIYLNDHCARADSAGWYSDIRQAALLYYYRFLTYHHLSYDLFVMIFVIFKRVTISL